VINLRYHIVSLVAVFLALGIGIVMGTTVIDKGVAAGLRARFDQVNDRASKLERDKVTLQRDLSLWEGFGGVLAPALVRDRLAGRTVTMLLEDGASDRLLADIRDGLARAGATVQGRVRLSDKWALDDEPAREQLAVATGTTSGDAKPLLARAADLLAERLAGSTDPRGDDDLLGGLSSAGFLAVEDAPAGQGFPLAGALLVVVPSGNGDSKVPERDFVLPLLGALARARATVVAERTDARRFLADAVRGDRALARTVATVDHADTAPGEIALAYALADLAAGRPPGHYGVRRGASGIVPALALPGGGGA
jgi:hypothetical protein